MHTLGKLMLIFTCSCIFAADLYDYGGIYDKEFNKDTSDRKNIGQFKSTYVEWKLTNPIRLFGDQNSNGVVKNQIHIHASGIITFTEPLDICPSSDTSFPGLYIAPYWVQVDLNRGGKVYYRQEDPSSSNSKHTNYTEIVEEINRGKNELKEAKADGDITVSDLTSVIFITWEQMRPPLNFFSLGDHRNTFQLVIVTTPTRQFALFLYERLDYYIFPSFQYYCGQAAVAGLNHRGISYNFQMTDFFYLAPYNLLLHSNIFPYNKLRRYLILIRDIKATVRQPAPPRLNCTVPENQKDPYCTHGIHPSFCALHAPGIYPHPSRCNNFVLCGPNGKLNVERCPSGVRYNPSIRGCDWNGYYRCNDVQQLRLIGLAQSDSFNTLISVRYLINQNTYTAFHNNTCFGIPEWGNAEDISSCENYLMCSNTRTYRLPCPLSWNGEQLYYNREKNYCDYKHNVVCENGKRPAGPTTPFFVPTTTSTTTRRRTTTTTIHPPGACQGIVSGNDIDPTSCAHYFSCQNGNVLHRFECQLGFNNQRLFYNREKNYCDYQSNVDCGDGIRPITTASVPTTKIPTTKIVPTEYLTEWSSWTLTNWGAWEDVGRPL
ncbi:dendrite extension defective protein 1-like [Hydractinia symbiolongicarpus]|uniref:dendrite extension defective protein 1-like n=1 Tax=Hydractinia symbiolongicarpus TaxID=13093 RepID=UPI00254B141C|nr:dendrite extension defective protein 1-like [Hydractinia symbiolongicarpus]